MVDLQVALNGDTTHPAMPRTAEEIARDAAASVAAGATLLHLHAFDDDGEESLAAGPVGRMLRAVRAACPGVPLNVTTFAAIVPDARQRLELVSSWTELPDLVAANQGEEGIDDVSDVLARRGVAIEACVLSVADADVDLPQLHHRIGIASWRISRRALARGHAIRTGLEDTSVLEDGTPATSNAQLTAAAAALVEEAAEAGSAARRGDPA